MIETYSQVGAAYGFGSTEKKMWGILSGEN
jgi:hypothetical protein